MKKMLMALFFIVPIAVSSQNEVCYTQMGCDNINGLYLEVSYWFPTSSSVDLFFTFKLTDGTSRSANGSYSFSGTGTRKLTIVSIPCNTVDFASQMSIGYRDGSGSLIRRYFVNGLCTGSLGCCVNPPIICNLSTTITTVPVTCTQSGSATVVTTGGTAPFTYLWSNGATTSSINAQEGSYQVTVYDANNCTSNSTAIITKNCNPNCNLSVSLRIAPFLECSKNGIPKPTTSLLAYGFGNFPPYIFNWSTGRTETSTTSSTHIPLGVGARTYSVTVTSPTNGCFVTKSIEVPDLCPLDCSKNVDNCRPEWEQFVLQTYAKDRCKIWDTDCNTTSTIRRSGKVALGPNLRTVPDGFNLAVQGGVIANEVKVKLCSNGQWCDYVFDSKYKLMPLLEVNNYIQQNKRLPNMPSTADIDKEGGYEMKKLTLLQQEKIEEAYLHLIKLEEQIKNAQIKIEAKRSQNNKISQLLK
jgi:hypothetical protein